MLLSVNIIEISRKCHKNGLTSRKETLWYKIYRAKLLQLFGVMKDGHPLSIEVSERSPCVEIVLPGFSK